LSLPDVTEGKATRATAELGGKLLELYAGVLAEVLRDLAEGKVPPQFLEPARVPLPKSASNGAGKRPKGGKTT
jgi:hypothetical protein